MVKASKLDYLFAIIGLVVGAMMIYTFAYKSVSIQFIYTHSVKLAILALGWIWLLTSIAYYTTILLNGKNIYWLGVVSALSFIIRTLIVLFGGEYVCTQGASNNCDIVFYITLALFIIVCMATSIRGISGRKVADV